MKPKGMWGAVALLAAMGWAGAVMAQSGSAGTNDAVEVTDAESVLTMRVDGEVVFDTQGRVIEHKVLTPKLTDDLRQFADKQLAAMRFEPVKIDGRPVNARTFARMILIARPGDNGGYAIEMESARFFKGQFSADGAPKADPADVEKAKLERSTWTVASQTRKPGYPRGLMRAGVSGAVVLRLLLREDGTVENAFVTQSALFNVRGRDKLLGQARGLFEKEALRSIRQWRFTPPAKKGPANDLEWRSGDIAVFFTMEDYSSEKAGNWRQEARGPRRVADWEIRRDKRLLAGVSEMSGDDGLVSPDPRIRRVQ